MKVLQEILVPLLSVNDQSLTIAELSFKTGEKIKKGDVIAVLETSKTTYTVEAETDGYINYFCSAGDDLPVNEVIARVYESQPDLEAQAVINKEKISIFTNDIAVKAERKVEHTIFSNRALELLSQHKLDKNLFAGYDLVSADDVRMKADLGYRKKTISFELNKTAKNELLQSDDEQDKATTVKLTSNKLREIEYLNSVQSSGLVSIIHTNVELEVVMPFLQLNMYYFKDSLLPVIIFETSKLLRKYPAFNAYYHNNSTVIYKNINIGFAVDIEKGLKVVKISDTEKRSIKAIEEEIIRLSGAYLDDKLPLEDLMDITFTITDLSNEKVAFFQPLINMKNSAILGISSVDKKLNRCILSLAFDHRVTEGKAAAVFLSELKERIESFTSAMTVEQVKEQKLATITCHRCMKTLLEDNSIVGFAQCITAEGKQDYICQACFKGF